jgi:NAD(P)-dependent dehydrogenase (short-subunit alcohol dehydrogenase family)
LIPDNWLKNAIKIASKIGLRSWLVQKFPEDVVCPEAAMIWSASLAIADSSAYSASNAGVHALVHNLALELAVDKIRINGVAPAVVETPIYSTFLSRDEVATVLPTFNAFHPLGRIGQPCDVAEAILFLLSDQRTTDNIRGRSCRDYALLAPGGHELGPDDIAAAQWWLSKDKVRRRVGA